MARIQPHSPLEFYRACDLNSIALQAMTACDPEFQASHNFVDILDRLGQDVATEIKEMVPGQMQNKDVAPWKKVEMEEQYDTLAQWLAQNRARTFPSDAKAPCRSCAQECFIRPPALREGIANAKGEPLQVACAGTTCVGWSAMGKRLGRADPAMLPFILWREERLCMKEDIVFHENSGRFPYHDLLEECCKEVYDCHTITVASNDLGYPFVRRRALTVMTKKASLVWLGPTTPEETEVSFYSFFRRTVCARGEDYLVDSPEHVAEEMKEQCEKKGFLFPGATDEEVLQHMKLSQIMSPSQWAHYQAAVRWAREQGEEYDGHLMVDCDQNPLVRQLGENSLFMPQLLTHGLVVSQRFQRPCTRRELLAVMGVSLDGGPYQETTSERCSACS